MHPPPERGGHLQYNSIGFQRVNADGPTRFPSQALAQLADQFGVDLGPRVALGQSVLHGEKPTSKPYRIPRSLIETPTELAVAFPSQGRG